MAITADILSYDVGAEGKHLNAEELKAAESHHMKMAECLKFDVSAHFVYDGKAGQ